MPCMKALLLLLGHTGSVLTSSLSPVVFVRAVLASALITLTLPYACLWRSTVSRGEASGWPTVVFTCVESHQPIRVLHNGHTNSMATLKQKQPTMLQKLQLQTNTHNPHHIGTLQKVLNTTIMPTHATNHTETLNKTGHNSIQIIVQATT